MLDLSGVKDFEAVAARHARESGAEVFGITATTPQLPAAVKVARAVKAARPDARTVLGGPHATLTLAAFKRAPAGRAKRARERLLEEFDVIVAGDGEDAIERVLQTDAREVDADDPGSPLFLTKKRLEELPPPARHLVDVGSYHYSIDGHRATSVIAQLGCPYACGFCAGRDSPFLRRTRTRSTDFVVDELETLYYTYGFTGFMFYDDELNVNPKMVELMNAVAETQKALGVEWRLRGFVKSELFTDEQAEAMVRAGFRWILTGFESGSDRMLLNINKRATKEDNTRCVEIAKRHGLKVKALMSIGHPGEDAQTVADTQAWLLAVRPDDFDVTIITPYPGSPYYDHATQTAPGTWVYEYQGDRLYQTELDYTETADYYKGDPDGGYVSYVHTDGLSPEALVELRDGVEREVRRDLGIPFNPKAQEVQYEHSMGQTGIPATILRKSRP
jgi:radical SAM superfamily enzyme YgiQ (UPF0313 family)